MKKSRYTETQIIRVQKEVEGGRLVKEVCRQYSIVPACEWPAGPLAIEIDLNLPALRVIRVFERAVAWRGYPNKLRIDGPEFISANLAEWAGILNMYVFQMLNEVRERTGNWVWECSE
tara:strand:+ start:28792 stop:29145 length:354 start_codon:yes stop_codon:yes gene_type:complete